MGCINVVVGDAGPCGRRWRSGRSVHGAALRDWPALGPDAPSARRLLTVSRPTGCGVVLSGDEVGVLGEQRASMNCCERAVWSTVDVDIVRKVSQDHRALRHAAVDCWRLRGREERVSQARVSRSETCTLFSMGDLFLLAITCVCRLHWSVRRGSWSRAFFAHQNFVLAKYGDRV